MSRRQPGSDVMMLSVADSHTAVLIQCKRRPGQFRRGRVNTELREIFNEIDGSMT